MHLKDISCANGKSCLILLLISFIYDYCTIYIPVLIYILDILILLHFFYEWNFSKNQAPEIPYAAWAANKQKQSKRLEHRTEHRTEHHKDTAGQLKLQQKQTTKNTRKSSQKLKLIKQKQLETTSCIKNRGWKLP